MLDSLFFEQLDEYATAREQRVIFIREVERLLKDMGRSPEPVRGNLILRRPHKNYRRMNVVYSLRHPDIHLLSTCSSVFEHGIKGINKLNGSYSWISEIGTWRSARSLVLNDWETKKINNIVEILNNALSPQEWWQRLLENADVWTQLLHHWEYPDNTAQTHMNINKKQALTYLYPFMKKTIASVYENTPALKYCSSINEAKCFSEDILDWATGCPFLTFDTTENFVYLTDVDTCHMKMLQEQRDMFVNTHFALYGRRPTILEVNMHWNNCTAKTIAETLPLPINF